MFADPTTVPSITITFDDSNPASGASTIGSGVVLNKVEGTGRKSVYKPSAAWLVAFPLSDVTLTINHSPTKAGRLRSQFRVDVSKVSTDGSTKSVSYNLTIDRSQQSTTDDNLVLQVVATVFQKLLFGASGSGAATTTANYSQLLNGES